VPSWQRLHCLFDVFIFLHPMVRLTWLHVLHFVHDSMWYCNVQFQILYFSLHVYFHPILLKLYFEVHPNKSWPHMWICHSFTLHSTWCMKT
jgi:hypothetical protein